MIITEHNHALKNIKQEDVKFIGACLYNAKIYDKFRLNISIKFESESEYVNLHDSTGFLKLCCKPTERIYSLNRHSEHPPWQGLDDIYQWAKAERRGENVDDPEFRPELAVGKCHYVGKRGSKVSSNPAYYTALALSFDYKQLPNGKIDADYLYMKLRVADFETEMELLPTPKDKHFSHIGREEQWHL